MRDADGVTPVTVRNTKKAGDVRLICVSGTTTTAQRDTTVLRYV